MKITVQDIQKKGFAVLHGKWGGSGKTSTIIGLNGKVLPSNSKLNSKCEIRNSKCLVGYLAYPNVGLKNIISDRRFFGYEKLIRLTNPPIIQDSFKTSGRLEQRVTKSEYIKKIKQIKELLAAGEIYQLCYSIRFRKKFSGSPYALFLKLAEVNPVDFAAYLNFGDYQIISSSPERFFKVHNGKITTTPIKGTTRKSENSNFSFFNFNSKRYFGDNNLKKLLESEKERAELDMITDLERNDIGKICEYGTLRLKKEREVLELKNLWHTFSEVEGKLRLDVGPEEVISAMFPGGSITGCPKRRAMEYISELEGLPRNIFTGSIGYISNSASLKSESQGDNINLATQFSLSRLNMDFNIAIRTVLIKDGYLEFWAGGGIVADSDPIKEYEECYLKAERFLGIIKNP